MPPQKLELAPALAESDRYAHWVTIRIGEIRLVGIGDLVCKTDLRVMLDDGERACILIVRCNLEPDLVVSFVPVNIPFSLSFRDLTTLIQMKMRTKNRKKKNDECVSVKS